MHPTCPLDSSQPRETSPYYVPLSDAEAPPLELFASLAGELAFDDGTLPPTVAPGSPVPPSRLAYVNIPAKNVGVGRRCNWLSSGADWVAPYHMRRSMRLPLETRGVLSPLVTDPFLPRLARQCGAFDERLPAGTWNGTNPIYKTLGARSTTGIVRRIFVTRGQETATPSRSLSTMKRMTFSEKPSMCVQRP